MNPEREIPVGPAVPRVDSFEIIEADCTPYLTDEQKTWPMVPLQLRVDSFGLAEQHPAAEQKQVGIRVSIPSDATADEAAAIVQKLRTIAEDIRAATGGRFPVQVDVPTA